MSNLHLSRASAALTEAGWALAGRGAGPRLSRPGPRATVNAFKASAAALLVGQSVLDMAATRPELQAVRKLWEWASQNSNWV